MRNRNKPAKNPNASLRNVNPSVPEQQILYEGERLARLLQLIKREIDSARNSNCALPEKVWLKQQFSVGVNEATRVLERMLPVTSIPAVDDKTPSVKLQAIILASDSNPRWLSKHLSTLASTRGVPVICVKDNGSGSLSLGQLVKLKTAICIGIKATGSTINQLIKKIIDNEIQLGIQSSTEDEILTHVQKGKKEKTEMLT